MKKNNITDMKLYKFTNRFDVSYSQLKKSLNRLPTIYELSKIDHLHYNGTNAVDFAINNTNINSQSLILDIGSGIGGPARYLAFKTNAKVFAVELQKELNDIGVRITNEYKMQDKVFHFSQDIHKFSIKDKKFDCVLSWLALYHIPFRKKLLKKIFAVLKKNGFFYTEDFFLIDKLSQKEKNNLGKFFHSNYLVEYDKYLRDLESAGFSIISHKDMSENWINFTRERLLSYKKNYEKNISLYGIRTTKNVLNFYQFAYDLLESKKIGGISFNSIKP